MNESAIGWVHLIADVEHLWPHRADVRRVVASGDPRALLGVLRRSLAFETGCAVMMLALVAWVETIEPPLSI